MRLDVDGAIAVITNDRPDKHNAFDDDMDAKLFEILAEIKRRPECARWCGEPRASRSRPAAT